MDKATMLSAKLYYNKLFYFPLNRLLLKLNSILCFSL
jgi:hypothetical protein